MTENHYNFFHCIRQKNNTFSRLNFKCRRVFDPLDIPVPARHEDEFLIPISSKIPGLFLEYCLTYALRTQIQVDLD